jgi:hypothetical protein
MVGTISVTINQSGAGLLVGVSGVNPQADAVAAPS